MPIATGFAAPIAQNQNYQFTAADGIVDHSFPQWSYGNQVINGMWASNNDTIDHKLRVSLASTNGALAQWEVDVPIGAGYGTAPAVDVMTAILGVGNTGILLGPNDFFVVGMTTAILSVKVVNVLLLAVTA
jgi:hypothetical protein